MWTLEIGTTHPDINGNDISPARVHRISVDNLDEIIENSVASLCAQIDWSPLVDDTTAPYVSETIPDNGDTETNIGTDVFITIKDMLPSAGIDLSNMKVFLNNGTQTFDITSEIDVVGDPYEYELRWSPPLRVYDRYE